MNNVDTLKKRAEFLAQLEERGNVVRSAAASGIPRSTLYKMRDEDPAFAAAWDGALQLGIAALEDEATDRAFDREDKASHVLLIFLLKAHKPSKYRDNPPAVTLDKGDEKPVDLSMFAQLFATAGQPAAEASPPGPPCPPEPGRVCDGGQPGKMDAGPAPEPDQPQAG